MYFTVFNFCLRFTISLNCDVISLSETGPRRGSHQRLWTDPVHTVLPVRYAYRFVWFVFLWLHHDFLVDSWDIFTQYFVGVAALALGKMCVYSSVGGVTPKVMIKPTHPHQTATKHNRSQTVCIILRIYFIWIRNCPSLPTDNFAFKGPQPPGGSLLTRKPDMICSKFIWLVMHFINVSQVRYVLNFRCYLPKFVNIRADFPAFWAPSQYKDRLIYVWRFPC